MFGCRYVCPENKGEFVAAYQAAQDETGPTVIEITSDRTENLAFHEKLHDKVRVSLKQS
jgi:2-succinyl-5-enolpyruvyl-6-hydroxy-3-cyclohexene-1-carboxylate synthase